MNTYFDYVDCFLLDFNKNGINWNALQEKEGLNSTALATLCQQFEVLLSFDFDAKNTSEILAVLKPKGMSIKGGTEEKVGFKSFDELDEIFEMISEEY